MDHYVQYRNPALVGGDCKEGIGGDFAIGTNKGLVRQLPGNKVWLICGQGRPRRYFLRHWFLVDEVGEVSAEESNGLFRFYAQGRIGRWFQPPLPLDGLPWFHEFRRVQSNFSFGLNRITAPFVVEFERLVVDCAIGNDYGSRGADFDNADHIIPSRNNPRYQNPRL